jgi:serine/threonine-protein kinase
MSVVYCAERIGADVEQTVAVKLLQRRLQAGDAEQRFRAEGQVLASLDHPNVAQFLDGGVTEGGRPYLVMEHVDGEPLTDYAETRDLALDARLDLLEQVLEAVETAHRQLVVHRDLKPSNVLVTETDDGTPRVKLLDFGIAKLLDDSLPVTRPRTQTGHPLMTPEYAAPEQLLGGDVTTRTDVYQLGVLAYELLSGTRPLDLSGKSLTEMERIITEEAPPPPSERAAEASRANPLRGDLDTILRKALRKEPERRYRSVEALSADLRRYRQDEPVEARPATLRYRARKFVTRNATGVGVAAAFLAVLVLAGTMLVRQRNRARRNAERARQKAETAEAIAEFMRGILGRNPSAPYKSNDFTGDGKMFINSPWASTVKEEMRANLNRLDEWTDDPLARAAVLHSVGQMLKDNRLNSWADSLLHRSLAIRRAHLSPSDPATVRTLGVLAHSKFIGGRTDSARVYLRRYLQHREQAGVRTRRDSARHAILSWRYAVTLPDSARRARTFRRALRRVDEVFGPRSIQRGKALLRYKSHVRSPAPRLLEEALSIFQARLDTLTPDLSYTHLRLAEDYVATGRIEPGLRHARTAIRQFGQQDTPRWYRFTRIEYADLLQAAGRFEQARSILREVRAWQRDHLPPVHKQRPYLLRVLATIDLKQDRYEAAASRFRRAIRINTQLSGPMFTENRMNRYRLARTLIEQGNREAAVDLLQKNAGYGGEPGKWVRKSRQLLSKMRSSSATSRSSGS